MDGRRVGVYPLTAENAAVIREVFPFAAPARLPAHLPSFGCGDRLGLANPGHLRALRGFRVAPVLAQQSVRELNLTGRSFTQVIDAATWAVLQEGYEGGFGADGDHLKTLAEVRMALAAGMSMITLDLSLCLGATGLPSCPSVLLGWAGQSFNLNGREVVLTEKTIEDFWRVYGAALSFIREADVLCREYRGAEGYDLEISVDETPEETRLEDHLLFGLEMERLGIRPFSLAPRFPGEFQKAVDYRGDLKRFEAALSSHAFLARRFGYRLSVHSGSDKFTVFPVVGRLTAGRFHLKTAGTSWLVALGVVAVKDPALFRRLYAKAVSSLAEAKKYYHIDTGPADVGPIDALPTAALPELLRDDRSRQLLHITYGQLLTDPELGPAFFRLLEGEEEAYYEALGEHFRRHFRTLGIPEEGSPFPA
ncbi:MAG: hypothetical protein GX493_09090 [Firmicutes bacterium]|nr:hypothetical protein [Bacillota bacterium]